MPATNHQHTFVFISLGMQVENVRYAIKDLFAVFNFTNRIRSSGTNRVGVVPGTGCINDRPGLILLNLITLKYLYQVGECFTSLGLHFVHIFSTYSNYLTIQVKALSDCRQLCKWF